MSRGPSRARQRRPSPHSAAPATTHNGWPSDVATASENNRVHFVAPSLWSG